MSDALNEMGAKICAPDAQIAVDTAIVFPTIPSVAE
jgi:hypothetical protein